MPGRVFPLWRCSQASGWTAGLSEWFYYQPVATEMINQTDWRWQTPGDQRQTPARGAEGRGGAGALHSELDCGPGPVHVPVLLPWPRVGSPLGTGSARLAGQGPSVGEGGRFLRQAEMRTWVFQETGTSSAAVLSADRSGQGRRELARRTRPAASLGLSPDLPGGQGPGTAPCSRCPGQDESDLSWGSASRTRTF